MENKQKTEKKRGKYSKKKGKMTLSNARKMLSIELEDLRLKAREIRFVAAFCMTWDQQKAYEMAGYRTTKRGSAASAASRLLNSVNVSAAIKRYVSKAVEPYKDRLNFMLLEMWYKRAFYDISVFYNSDGTRKELDEIPQEWRVCIDGIAIKRHGKNPMEDYDVLWNICNRTEALKEIRTVLEMAIGKDQMNDMPGDEKDRIQMILNREYKKLGIKREIIPFEPLKKVE